MDNTSYRSIRVRQELLEVELLLLDGLLKDLGQPSDRGIVMIAQGLELPERALERPALGRIALLHDERIDATRLRGV